MTPETNAQIKAYDALLKKWQGSINLVSSTTLDDSKTRHFEDSWQILPMIAPSSQTLYDLGSGAGFPGLVIAIYKPQLNVHLIESNTKKTNFLKTVARELELKNVTVHSARIEDMAQDLPPPDVITARALSSLIEIFDLTRPWTKANANLRYVLLKGKTAKQEIAQALSKYHFSHFSAPSTTDPEASVLRIEGVTVKQAA